jgi:hypothetical protein
VIEDRFFELIDPVLRSGGSTTEDGEEFRQPALDIIRYYRRPVRWNSLPFFGRGLSVVAVARRPQDIQPGERGFENLLNRLARAASSRFPPWTGSTIGLTLLLLTAEPVEQGDESLLEQALDVSLRRFRVVPFGLFQVNLVQEAIAWALRSSPDQLFPEPVRLADALGEELRRFVPRIEA